MISFEAFSQNSIEVQELSQESCWAKEEDGVLKLASFSEGVSVDITQEEVTQFLSLQLNLQERPDYLKTYLHCGSYGHHLVFNLKVKGQKHCFWARKTKSSFESSSYGFTLQNGFCDGNKMGSLFLKKNQNISLEKALKKLETYLKKGTIKSYSVLSERFIKLQLKESEYFQEQQWGIHFESYQEFSGFELDPFLHPVGEFTALNELSLE